MCSVQEHPENKGVLAKLKSLDQLVLDKDQVAALAVFDTMTLNSDRHTGNMLVDKDNNLIPIDHGRSLTDPSMGNRFLGAALGGPFNALVRIPNAHAPMSDKMLKKLKAIDPDAFKGLSQNALPGIEEDRVI